jgi:hypothetical protein
MPSQLPELPLEALSQRFRQFAFHVSQQASPLYTQLSVAVADDPELLMLASHAGRGQPAPNIFFAAIHFLLLQGCSIPSQRSICGYAFQYLPCSADNGLQCCCSRCCTVAVWE